MPRKSLTKLAFTKLFFSLFVFVFSLSGIVGNLTHCRCSIPNGINAGTYVFTIKVVKNGVEEPTANLSIILYDSVSTKVTSLQPSEIFTAETTEVTFGGSGLTESSTAVCMVNGTKIKAVFLSGSYICTLGPFAKSQLISLALSLNGVHELASDVSLIRTVYARGPTLTSAQFSDTGALIDVVFNKDVDRSSLARCDGIFESATVLLLGTSPVCSWSDGRHLTISPGTSPSILPNNTLTLKADAVKCRGELYSKYASGSAIVGDPANPVQPKSIIIGKLSLF